MSAEIIAFPTRRPTEMPVAHTAPAAGPGRVDQTAAAANLERLRIALEALDAANDSQRKAVATWREAIANLRVAVQDLGTKLRRSQDQLGQLRQGIDGLAERNLRLQRWAAEAESRGQAYPAG